MTNLRSVDLNLLVAFDTLMRTRHVSRAADLLGIGQPGMSAALSRLRQLLGDPLLVKQGTEMRPTQRALDLEPEVRMILREIGKLLGSTGEFDPATSTRTFRVRMSDLLSTLLLPKTIERLSRTAPGLRLQVDHLSPNATVDALERDIVELAVSTGLDIPKSIMSHPLFEDHLVCLAHQDFPIAHHLRDIRTFASLPQIRVSQSPLDDRFADRQLGEQGLKRDIALTVPHWLTVPEILASAPLVALVPALSPIPWLSALH